MKVSLCLDIKYECIHVSRAFVVRCSDDGVFDMPRPNCFWCAGFMPLQNLVQTPIFNPEGENEEQLKEKMEEWYSKHPLSTVPKVAFEKFFGGV